MTTTALTEHEDPAYYWLKPRPDQPERFDEQTAFVNSKTTGVKWMVGGNGAGTTTISLLAAARFLLTTPPPRKDTPFFIISTDFTTVMEACWAEKLEGMGIIPPREIDYDRIVWFKQGPNWPRRVPLKPWGKRGGNWVIEFRSLDQGRKRQQARSVGGFLFVEQFPWNVLTEVLRGCREYNFPGSKICEFTPIDPALCVDIEEMVENGPEPADPEPGRRYFPKGWELYRANTQCAMEAGHISKEWFEEFFGMVPEEMRDTRMTGAFASYEGAIYKHFLPAIHCKENSEFEFPANCFHRRVIDWGSGGDHPFVCLWAYRDERGAWWIYDEIYCRERKTTPEYLKMVDERSKSWGWDDSDPHYGVTWADTAEPGSMLLASQLSHHYPECNDISIAGAKKRILPGIEHVQMYLKPADGGQPKLFIHAGHCPNTRREFRAYRWLASPEMGLNPRLAKREPLDKDNHTMDCVRYLVFSEDNWNDDTIEVASRRHETTSVRNTHGVRLARGES